MSNNLRINKILAQAGVCSRRKADELIEAGQVLVNGQIAKTGMSLNPEQDVVSVNGKKVDLTSVCLTNVCPDTLRRTSAKHNYIILNKPIEVVSTVQDPQGRRTVLNLIPARLLYEDGKKKRLYPVGRLDYFSEGLILLTDDGDLTHRLTHPTFELPRVYLVKVRGLVSAAKLETMRSGMTLSEGDKLAPMRVETLRESELDEERSGRKSRSNSVVTTLQITLVQGLNRQIRRVCRDLNLTILRLRRISHGPLSLGDLATGASRALSPSELTVLFKAVGLSTDQAVGKPTEQTAGKSAERETLKTQE